MHRFTRLAVVVPICSLALSSTRRESDRDFRGRHDTLDRRRYIERIGIGHTGPYLAMMGMIFGDVPTFDQVIASVARLEHLVNS